MPMILRVDGYRVTIFTDDHEPPHVHVFKAGSMAIFLPDCSARTATLRERKGFSFREASLIAKKLVKHVDFLCESWRQVHVYAD